MAYGGIYSRSLSPALQKLRQDEGSHCRIFLPFCRQDRGAYANAAGGTMWLSAGCMVDTAGNPGAPTLLQPGCARYPAFEEFYGMEDAIEQIVSYLKHAAQGWKRRSNSYLLGRNGGGKSSLAERLKSLMQRAKFMFLSASGERESGQRSSVMPV